MNHNLLINKRVTNIKSGEIYEINHVDDLGVLIKYSRVYLESKVIPNVSKFTPLVVLHNDKDTIIEVLNKSFYDEYIFTENEEKIGKLNIQFNRTEYSYLVELLREKILDRTINTDEIDFYLRLISELKTY